MQNYTPISVFETTNLFETLPQLFNLNFTVTDEFSDKPVSNYSSLFSFSSWWVLKQTCFKSCSNCLAFHPDEFSNKPGETCGWRIPPPSCWLPRIGQFLYDICLGEKVEGLSGQFLDAYFENTRMMDVVESLKAKHLCVYQQVGNVASVVVLHHRTVDYKLSFCQVNIIILILGIDIVSQSLYCIPNKT